MISSLSEITSSVSAGSLRGVIILERGYDEKGEQAWVKVGISKKTMATSGALEKALQGSDGQETPKSGQPAPEQPELDPSLNNTPEVQRYGKDDW